MKNYTKPVMEITSYEAKNIMMLSAAGIEAIDATNTKAYGDIHFN